MEKVAKVPTGRERRRLRNLLLDRHFQLKYAGFVAGVAAVLSLALGLLIWRSGQTLVSQSRQTVEQGQQIVELGRKVADESRKVSDVVEMNIVKEYSDTPELAEVFKTDSAKRKRQIEEQQRALEQQASALTNQAAAIETGQRTLLVTLFSVLAALVVALTLVGIWITHKVAGPIFKMSGQIRALGEGRWRMPYPLRKGDELVAFFETFRQTVGELRERREQELARLDELKERLADKLSVDDEKAIDALRRELAVVLEDGADGPSPAHAPSRASS